TPSARISSATALSSFILLLVQIARFAPSRANCSAASRPMLRLAPVMRTFLPFSPVSMLRFLYDAAFSGRAAHARHPDPCGTRVREPWRPRLIRGRYVGFLDDPRPFRGVVLDDLGKPRAVCPRGLQ